MTAPAALLFDGADRHSITHHHLHGVLATEAQRRDLKGKVVRILDAGCGNGALMDFLSSSLPRALPSIAWELHGFDIADSKVQKADFFAGTLARLGSSHPGIDWPSRLAMIDSTQGWPHPDGHFDFIVSNQVLEHVRDHRAFFAQLSRTLHPDGLSAHIFPLADSWTEWHLKMPFAHWFTNSDLAEAWIRLCSRLGLGTWKRYCGNVAPVGLGEFASMNRDFLAFETNYVTEDDIRRLAKVAGLKYSFRYTDDFYLNRLRMARRRPLRYDFPERGAFAARLRFMAYRRISGICLVLEKRNTYVNRGFHTPGE